jgi:hypothetical protein
MTPVTPQEVFYYAIRAVLFPKAPLLEACEWAWACPGLHWTGRPSACGAGVVAGATAGVRALGARSRRAKAVADASSAPAPPHAPPPPVTGRLTTGCVKALLRIFLMCDHDQVGAWWWGRGRRDEGFGPLRAGGLGGSAPSGCAPGAPALPAGPEARTHAKLRPLPPPQDGALSDDELNGFQALVFGAPLAPDELGAVKAMVAERMPEGLGDAVRGAGWGGAGLFGCSRPAHLFTHKGR